MPGAPGRPLTCGRCGVTLEATPGKAERFDATDCVIVGFLDCPHCAAAYVYIRALDPGERQRFDAIGSRTRTENKLPGM
jgi:hypothetical protein